MNESEHTRYAEAAAWAASNEAAIDPNDPSLLRGEEARQFSRDLLSRIGRQPLDPTMTKGERSPRRQVRLPEALSTRIDAIAQQQHRSASAVMREAIEEYVRQYKTPA